MSDAAILVVDDVEMNRDVLTMRLRQLGHTNVTMAQNGQEALDRLQADRFDLVLLDIMMPVLDGYGVLERLRADGTLARVPVIVVSALNEMDSVARCLQLGAEDYLTKPINATLLGARVAGSLEKKGLRDEARRHLERMEHDLLAARELQLGMVPADVVAPTPSLPLTVHALMQPAREVGGDLCDFFPVDPGAMALVVGDVSGKGAAAALFMARTHGAVRAAVLRAGGGADPAAVLATVNAQLARDNHAMMFTTLFLGLLDLATGALRFATAGHGPPYLLAGGRAAVAAPPARTPPAGVNERAVYRTEHVTLGPGDGLVAYTDGVTEAHDPAGELYGEERLEALLARHLAAGGGEIVAAVGADVAAFAGTTPQFDDITLLVLRRAPA